MQMKVSGEMISVPMGNEDHRSSGVQWRRKRKGDTLVSLSGDDKLGEFIKK